MTAIILVKGVSVFKQIGLEAMMFNMYEASRYRLNLYKSQIAKPFDTYDDTVMGFAVRLVEQKVDKL